VYRLFNFLPMRLFIEPIVLSSTFKFELERLFRIGRETNFRHAIYSVKNFTAVTVNILLVKTSPIQIARSDISKICAHPRLV